MRDQVNRFKLLLSLRGKRRTSLPMATRITGPDTRMYAGMVIDQFLDSGEEALLPYTLRNQGGL